MIRERGALRLSAISTTPGRVLAASPISTSHTSPWRGFMAVKNIQNLLLDLARRQHVGPSFFLALLREEFQIMQDLAQDRLWLSLDFLKQHFLSAHIPG